MLSAPAAGAGAGRALGRARSPGRGRRPTPGPARRTRPQGRVAFSTSTRTSARSAAPNAEPSADPVVSRAGRGPKRRSSATATCRPAAATRPARGRDADLAEELETAAEPVGDAFEPRPREHTAIVAHRQPGEGAGPGLIVSLRDVAGDRRSRRASLSIAGDVCSRGTFAVLEPLRLARGARRFPVPGRDHAIERRLSV